MLSELYLSFKFDLKSFNVGLKEKDVIVALKALQEFFFERNNNDIFNETFVFPLHSFNL